MTALANAAEVIAALGLKPHPEGGHFRETFRDREGPDGRAHSTAILYLLAAGERSGWHRVLDAAEIWHFHAGAPLLLERHDGNGPVSRLKLGGDFLAGEHLQIVVPKACWQSARSVGDWSLVGCTVAPGFQFAGLEIAPEGWSPGT